MATRLGEAMNVRRWSGTLVIGAAAAAALLAACGPPARPASAGRDLSPYTSFADGYAERRLRFLEIAERQMRSHASSGDADGARWASGALVAAALASRGRDPAAGTGAGAGGKAGLAEEAARWGEAALAACGGRWTWRFCPHAQLSLQRLVLEEGEALPPPLLARLRQAAASSLAPPPDAEEIGHPWRFRETENQRIVACARSLAGAVAAGEPGSPEARAWAAYAVAFLAAHERDGWYESESAGYMAVSIVALLQLHDLAPDLRLREVAGRQLSLLLARWAQNQAGGYPAGPRSRTYVQWALGAGNTAWPAWAWLAGGFGEPERLSLVDAPELALTGFRIPPPIRRLLVERRRQPPYSILERRRIDLPTRRGLDTALASYATSDYVLGVSQSVGGLRLAVSGGQEIPITLYPEGTAFAPLYLWSRTRNALSERWKTWSGQDLAAGDRNLAVGRLGVGGRTTGHVYLAPGWSEPRPAGGGVLVARCGDTYVALATVGGTSGGWEVERAALRFPAYYADPTLRDAWVAVPWRQPAAVGLEVARRADVGGFDRWTRLAAGASLAIDHGVLRFTSTAGRRLAFHPGVWARVDGRTLHPEAYPLLAGPFLWSPQPGAWSFAFAGSRLDLSPLPRPGAPRGAR